MSADLLARIDQALADHYRLALAADRAHIDHVVAGLAWLPASGLADVCADADCGCRNGQIVKAGDGFATLRAGCTDHPLAIARNVDQFPDLYGTWVYRPVPAPHTCQTGRPRP